MDFNIAVQHQMKIQQLFQKFLEPDFEIKNDTYLSRLLTHLSNQEKPVDATVADNQFFSEWLVEAVSVWEENKLTPSINISSFTLTLASIVSRSENRFILLNTNNFYVRLIQIVKARQPEVSPSVKLGYIKLLSSFLEHKTGVQWIVACDLWADVLRFTLTNQTMYITREGCRFMAKLLEQTIDYNETFCHNVVKQIMLPLSENTYKTLRAGEMMEISDESVYQSLGSTLQLVGNILEYFLESVLFAQNDCRIVLIFLRDFHLEQVICNFMMIARNKYFIFDLGKIMFIMQFLELYIGVISTNLKVANVKTSIRKIMSIFTTNTSKGNSENVMKLCFYGQYYWNLMGYKIPCVKVNKDNEPISFANQLLVIQLLPIFALAMKYCVTDSAELIADEFRDQYVQKLFVMMCENTVRIAYGWRDFLVAQHNLFEIATKGLIYVMKSRKYYPRERAAMAFQSFVYALKDVMRAIKESPEKLGFFAQQVGFFSLLFDAFVVFIEEFQITWRDSVETICIMSLCFDFLSIPTWPTQLVVKALKLVNVSLVKYMSPNLALLVDRTTDSTLAVLGSLLNTKLHDMTWEVRDSALEVVCTISHMSSTNVESTLIALPIFAQWIKRAVPTWSAAGVTPRADVASFTLSLASLLSKNEERFCSLNSNNFYIKLVNVVKARRDGEVASIKLAYIKLLSSFLEHTSGVEWMIACSFWEDVFQLRLSDHDEVIIRESTSFISKILEKTIEYDESFCSNVVKRIMLPLGENIYKSLKASNDLMEVCEGVASQYLKPTLKLIGDILEHFLEGIHFDRTDFQVVLLFLKNFHLEERISDFMIIAQSKCLVFDLGKIMFIMQFLELYVKVVTNSISVANINASICRMKNNFLLNISRGTFEDVMEFCDFGQLFWNLIDSKISLLQLKNDTDSAIPFSNQLLILQVLPHFCIILKYCYEMHGLEELLEEEFRDVYIHKLFHMMCQTVVRSCYSWRDNITSRSDLFEICFRCNMRFEKSRKYFSRDKATIIVQSLIYNLKDVVTAVKRSPQKIDLFAKELPFFSQVMELLIMFIQEFQITWKDTLEAVDMLTIAFDFLMMHRWPGHVVIQLLRLINVATAQYMAPSLALLLDSTTDSTIALLGPLLFAKLHDEMGDVKCAALEVICTMARMSGNKIWASADNTMANNLLLTKSRQIYENNTPNLKMLVKRTISPLSSSLSLAYFELQRQMHKSSNLWFLNSELNKYL